MSYRIGFIGAGNMSAAILGGMVKQGVAPERIIASNRSTPKLEALADEYGIHTSTDNHQAAKADVVVLSVKPQMMKDVCLDLAPSLGHKPLIVTVAAGLPMSRYEQWLGADQAIVRCMPNTPSLVGKGASGLFANARVSDLQKSRVEEMMGAVGVTAWVAEESLIDAVIAVAGSAPAYFFLMMEAMIDQGEAMGLDRATARALTLQTAAGAAELAASADVPVDELRRRVMSPGGTTEQAVFSFERDDIRAIVSRAMTCCANRAAEMAKEMGN
ncbi:pyrroline-5-carboxylate reductase [Simiduia sp. 21SJ11W-1]|uniref:pyrroline-5-carboxylate reductase n=1 Tax=Simiduia sp. 21SJ11W-1 TaxID=2909669 RepID=UPI00209E684A|nr:pyrroline-5-carboxylate reductase [Simiduia sp. 21SJ11W-1]UTA48221.1 pyrroline-5-carboxylate reductase [Simiduia sp. 21SJ11W-1]